MNILDRKFRYTPSSVHNANPLYLRDKFRRMIREMAKQPSKVTKIGAKK